MKKEFIGYYTPSESEFQDLWTEGRIVVDANVLLAVYGVSPSTRDTLSALLKKVKERLWIPNHFALEYRRNRLGKILEQVKHYEDVRRNLQAILEFTAHAPSAGVSPVRTQPVAGALPCT